MSVIAFCLGGQEHDPWLVLLALLVCVLGSSATAQLYGRTEAASGRCRIGWVLLTSAAAGATVWCTHFVAMLAYRTDAAVVLDPFMTLCSLLLAIGVTVPGVLIATSAGPRLAALGGAVIGGAVAAMHYAGMAAYHVNGVMLWDRSTVALSVLLSVLLAAASLAVRASGSGFRHWAAGVLLFSLAVASLHFTGMRALTVIPAGLHGEGLSPASMSVLAISTALAGLLLVGCAAVSALIDGHMQAETFQRLNRLARYDWLTGLPNRMHIHDHLQDMLARPLPEGGQLAVVKFNLVQFKAINASHGTQSGDRVLADIAARVARMLQQGEHAARLGSDEFVVIKPVAETAELDEMLRRLSRTLGEPLEYPQFTRRIEASTGVCLAPGDGMDAGLLLANADLAMSVAKAAQSRLPCFYGPAMDDAARDKRDLTEQLRESIGTDQFEMHYQVKISLLSGEVSGYEALLRWRHPARGPVPPTVFIPLAEEIGEITRLSDWVLRQACREAANWAVPHKVAVNLSPLQLSEPGLIDRLRATLAETGLPPAQLELELTESAILKDRDSALSLLREIQAMGVLVSLDDFGTGFSSLDVLRSFPFDRIKLDRSFMAEIESSREAVAILRSVTTLGRWLSIPVLAEGIETAAQLEIAEREGCRDVQGYLLGRPRRLPLTPERLGQIVDTVELLRSARHVSA